MDKDELIKYLKENLKIKIEWANCSSIGISLILENEIISSSECDTDFAEYNHSHEWDRDY
jgi:hypothetical protein